ncbi:Cobyric acid synthase [Streptomyces microflavus]
MLTNVAAVVLDGVNPFELGVVCEVFGTDRSDDGLPVYDFAVASAEGPTLTSRSGFSLHVEHGLERLESADLIAVPAGACYKWREFPPELLEALRRGVERGARVLSVCSEVLSMGPTVGAILWNLLTWLVGLPCHSSHALFGGLIGAAVMSAGWSSINGGTVVTKVLLPAIAAPLVAGLAAMLATRLTYRINRNVTDPNQLKSTAKGYRAGQIASAGLVSLAHGTNDAQTMGVVALGGRTRLEGGRRAPPQPERGAGGGRVRGGARCTAGRDAGVRGARRAPAGPERGVRAGCAECGHRTRGAAVAPGESAGPRRVRGGPDGRGAPGRGTEAGTGMSGSGERGTGTGAGMGGGLLVAGTTSNGKSVVTAGICRWLVRRGVKVAPFKAQERISLNSFVTREGAEIGRAQAMQAQAARVEPTALMNPVLLKPGSGPVEPGRPDGQAGGRDERRGYHGGRQEALLGTVTDCLEQLRSTYDAVICEGAGSPAEINLRRTDIVNMGIARAAKFPVLVVGDIDRGGVFASFFGTTALLSAEDQSLVAGYLVNKFRGDVSLLEPGLDMLYGLTGRRTYGVLPFTHGLGIDEEDGLRVSMRGAVRESVVAPRTARRCCGWRSARCR